MSFIYATKVPYDDFGQERENVQIFSETMKRNNDHATGYEWIPVGEANLGIG